MSKIRTAALFACLLLTSGALMAADVKMLPKNET